VRRRGLQKIQLAKRWFPKVFRAAPVRMCCFKETLQGETLQMLADCSSVLHT